MKKMNEIDRYHLNLFCKCLKCSKRGVKGFYKACKAYPKNNGIPPEIWNGKDAYCEYYEPDENNANEQ